MKDRSWRDCRNCRHAGRQDDGRVLAAGCLHPTSKHPPGDPPEIRHHTMAEMRADEEACGSIGMWFEPLFASPDAQAAWVRGWEAQDATSDA